MALFGSVPAAVTVLGLALNAVLSAAAFKIALNVAALGIIVAWGTIVLCQLKLWLRFRKGLVPRPEFRMFGAPVTGVPTLGFLAAMVVLMVLEYTIGTCTVASPMVGWYMMRGRIQCIAAEQALTATSGSELMTNTHLPLIAVIATGGTIASRRDAMGANVPDLDGQALLARLKDLPPVRLRPIDLYARDSSTLGLEEMQGISDAVGRQLADPEVAGIVVLHGTDSMEETSLLVSLQHRARCPVVFTGAQFTDDHPEADGPANMTAAIHKALSPDAGVHLAFGGRETRVWGLYKHSADAPDAFRPCGRDTVAPDGVHLPAPVNGLRVDLVAIHPGADALHIDASLAAGATGIVLVALGSGNATPAVVDAVRRCVRAGVPVVTSSRVPQGRLTASYGGGGGGHDLQQAGALHAARLRPGQARILLAALIASGQVDILGPALFAHA